MDKISEINVEVQSRAYFQSDTHINLEPTDVKEILAKVIKQILGNISIFQHEGSRWYFKEVINLEIHTVDYKPMRGGSSYIPLPDKKKKKKAIVSIRNSDNKCFIWSVLRYLYPKEKNDCRLSDLKKHENELNTKGIKFPVKIKDISKFESLNPNLPGINVFSVYDNKKFYPLRMAKKDPEEIIDLFIMKRKANTIIHLLKTFLVFFVHKLQKEQMNLFIFVNVVLLILRKTNYYQNILNIVHIMKQLL